MKLAYFTSVSIGDVAAPLPLSLTLMPDLAGVIAGSLAKGPLLRMSAVRPAPPVYKKRRSAQKQMKEFEFGWKPDDCNR